MTELNPCPFCGSKNLRKSKNFTITEAQMITFVTCVQCCDCGCDGPKIAYVDDPLKAWNERK